MMRNFGLAFEIGWILEFEALNGGILFRNL